VARPSVRHRRNFVFPKQRIRRKAVSTNDELLDGTISYTLLRVFLGVDIAMHGISRLIDYSAFQRTMESQFTHAPLPHFAIVGFAITLPWAEALIGLLVGLGLWTRLALVIGALEMIVLTFGACLIQQWEIAGIQLIYQIAYSILLFLHGYNRWSADAFLGQAVPSGEGERSLG
jgi:thiosulfate dehydrogenase (quinone) large subunit